jgi:large subunit ribosomal protein L29
MLKKKTKQDHSLQEIGAKIIELDRDIFVLRNELAINRKLEKPHLIRTKKREKARMLTLLTQKQRSSSKGVA